MSLRDQTESIKIVIDSGTPADLNIAFTFIGISPTSFSKWYLRLIQTGIYVSGIAFDIKYSVNGTLLSGVQFEIPSTWLSYMPTINNPDVGNTIISNPGTCIFMSDDTTFSHGSCVIEKQGSIYIVKGRALSNLTAGRFKGVVTWDNDITFI